MYKRLYLKVDTKMIIINYLVIVKLVKIDVS